MVGGVFFSSSGYCEGHGMILFTLFCGGGRGWHVCMYGYTSVAMTKMLRD